MSQREFLNVFDIPLSAYIQHNKRVIRNLLNYFSATIIKTSGYQVLLQNLPVPDKYSISKRF